jgi:hypothetical protein
MRSVNATKVHRKSGVAKWRDLLFSLGPAAAEAIGHGFAPTIDFLTRKANDE